MVYPIYYYAIRAIWLHPTKFKAAIYNVVLWLDITRVYVIRFYDFLFGGSSLIPDYIVSPLTIAPEKKHVSLLVRHSIRFPINVPEETLIARLTPEGVQLAKEFGAWLVQRRHLYRVMASPVGRCVDTGRAVIQGAGWPNPVVVDQKLGFPFVENGWQKVTNKNFLAEEIPQEAFKVLNFLLEDTGHDSGLNIHITHDGNIAFMAMALLGEPITEENWPDYLEGMAFWREEEAVRIAWRGKVYELKKQGVLAIDLVQ